LEFLEINDTVSVVLSTCPAISRTLSTPDLPTDSMSATQRSNVRVMK